MPDPAHATILTVEDNAVVRADLRLILEDAGFEVCASAQDGVEAVALAHRHRPDLVLLDLGLPLLDGVEATRRITATTDATVVALTGASSPLLAGAFAAGATHHVPKPFSEAQLVETLHAALAEHAAAAAGGGPAYDRHAMVAIEAALRDGLSEREIEWMLHRDFGHPAPAQRSWRDLLNALLGRS